MRWIIAYDTPAIKTVFHIKIEIGANHERKTFVAFCFFGRCCGAVGGVVLRATARRRLPCGWRSACGSRCARVTARDRHGRQGAAALRSCATAGGGGEMDDGLRPVYGVRELAPAFQSGGKPPRSKMSPYSRFPAPLFTRNACSSHSPATSRLTPTPHRVRFSFDETESHSAVPALHRPQHQSVFTEWKTACRRWRSDAARHPR